MTATRIPSHHPSCYSLMRYASGFSSPGMRVLIESHLELCPRCRHELQAYEAEAGLGLESLAPEEMDTRCLDNLLHKIDEHGPPACIDVTLPAPQKADSRFPEALQRLTGLRGEKILWERASAADKGSLAQAGHAQLRLLQVHASAENAGQGKIDMMLVLDGALVINDTRYTTGDVVHAMRHVTSARAETETLCLIVTPLKEDQPSLFRCLLGMLGLGAKS